MSPKLELPQRRRQHTAHMINERRTASKVNGDCITAVYPTPPRATEVSICPFSLLSLPSSLLQILRPQNPINNRVHSMHLIAKPAILSIDACNALLRALLDLWIWAMVAIYAIEFSAGGTLLADCLSSDDTQPLEIVLVQLGFVSMGTSAITG